MRTDIDSVLYTIDDCKRCGSPHFVSVLTRLCQSCAIKELREELDHLKKNSVPFTTSCDPDVGWGGD